MATTAPYAFVPLTSSIPYWPSQLADTPVLDEIGVRDFHVDEDKHLLKVSGTLLWLEEIAFDLPGIDGFSIAFLSANGYTAAPFEIDILPEFGVKLPNLDAALRIQSDALKPVQKQGDTWVPVLDASGQPKPAQIELSGVGLAVNAKGDIDVTLAPGGPKLSLGAVALGDTGVVLEVDGVTPYLSTAQTPPTGAPPGFRGVGIDEVKLHLPPDLDVPLVPSDLQFDHLVIGTSGFSGTVTGSWTPTFANGEYTGNGSGSLFGIPFGLESLSITFKQNVPTASEIKGQVNLPFFDNPVSVDVAVGVDGSVKAALSTVQPQGATYSGGLVTLEKEGVLSLELDAIGFEVHQGVVAVKLSGKLTPEIAQQSIDWPTFEVTDLTIDSQGHVNLPGGWLDLPDGFAIDFFAFKIEIVKLGFGRTDDGYKWVGFSGGIDLVEGLPAGASVEGLRVNWKENETPHFSLAGVGVEFEVPGAVSFKGDVSYREFTDPVDQSLVHRFDGDISLNLEAVSLEIDAALVIGSAGPANNPYTFFAIYVDVELPAGIPLGNTGIGLYGFAGLFALNMEPNRHPDEPWYGVGASDGWYHRGAPQIPPGVTDLRTKWDNRRDSLALGAGITLGTVADNGYTFSGKVLLVIVFPGPILMIEGKANLLKERSTLTKEPLFRTLAVLDFRAETMQFGLDVHFAYDDGGALIDIKGGVDAFYDFKDPNAWHIYLGEKEPREKRIQADIFQLFQANAYLMLDAHQLAAGAWVGYDKKWSFGPLDVTVEAWIEGEALLSFKPVHFNGELWMHGKAALKAFGFGVSLAADARLTAEVFDPMHIKGDFSVSIDLPWPLHDISADVPLEWGPQPTAPPLPVPLKEIAIAHFKATTTWPLPRSSLLEPVWDSTTEGFLDTSPPSATTQAALPPPQNAPTVPLDARPRITFSRNVNDDAQVGAVVQPVSPEFETIGDPSKGQAQIQARYAVKSVRLDHYDGSAWHTVVQSGAGLYGSWAPVPTLPEGNDPVPGQTKLWLWSRSSFDYTMNTSAQWNEWFTDHFPDYPCIPPAPDRTVCFDFQALGQSSVLSWPWTPPNDSEFQLSWQTPPSQAVEVLATPILGLDRGLHLPGTLTIELAEPAEKVVLTVADLPARETRTCIDYRNRPAGTGPNPRHEGKVTIEVLDAARRPLSQTTVGSTRDGAVTVGAIATGHELVAELDCAAIEVEVTLVTQAEPLEARGYNAAGLVVDAAKMTVGQSQAETLTLTGTGIVKVVVVAPADESWLVSLCWRCQRPAAPMQATATGAGGTAYGPATATANQISLSGTALKEVVLDGPDGVFLLGACATIGQDPDEVARRQAMTSHNRDATEVWSGTGEVLDPDTDYRIVVDTEVKTQGFPYDPSFNTARTQEYFAYFRTEGPPGLAQLSVPEGNPNPDEFKSGLDTLERYVTQTVPPTVPATGELPPLPRPVYRAYDVGVEFDVDYVDLMYRVARRDLGLYLYDASNQLVRDAAGRLIVLANEWGSTSKLSLTQTDQEMVKLIDQSACLTLDQSGIPKTRTLTSADAGQVLSADTVYDARLVPLLLHEAFEAGFTNGKSASGPSGQLGGWTVSDEGTNAGPSKWVVAETGSPPSRYVQQTSSIWGGSPDVAEAAKPGTTLSTGDLAWSDYRLSAFLRASSGAALGLVFRHTDNDNHYRFSMDVNGYRRLVRVVGGRVTVLAEDDLAFDLNRDYLVTIEAIGSHLAVYLDGAAVFAVDDTSLETGRVGLYAWDNPTAGFSDVRVDDISSAAPVTYHFKFTTSRFANFFHQLGSYDDLTWQATVAGATLTAAQAPAAEPSDAEHRAYDDLAHAALASAADQDPPSVEVTRIEQGTSSLGLLVRGPEPIDWARTTIVMGRAAVTGARTSPPGIIKLCDANVGASSPADEWIEVLLRDQLDPTGAGIEQLVPPPPIALPPGPGVLLHETFDGPDAGVLFDEQFGQNALDAYDIVDQGPYLTPSQWSVSGGAIVQSSDIYGGSVAPSELLKPGTVALFGRTLPTDVRIKAKLSSSDDDAIGLVFRYASESDYYRFSMDSERAYRRLVKVSGGAATLLWEDSVAYDVGRSYTVVIACRGGQIAGMLDGVPLFAVTDTDVSGDRAGLYSWGNDGAVFEAFSLASEEPGTLWFKPDMGSVVDFRIVDAAPGRSAWSSSQGTLQQKRRIGDGGLEQRGTYAVAPVDPLDDFAATVRVRARAKGGVGIMFRYVDDDNFYRLSLSQQPSRRQLIKKVRGQVKVLWHDNGSVQVGSWQQLSVSVSGAQLTGSVDGVELFTVYDADLQGGRLALYCWRVDDAEFDGLTVVDATRRVGSLLVRDDGSVGEPSAWTRTRGYLRQTSSIGGATAGVLGTVVLGGEPDWSDYRVTARMRSLGTGATGVCLRYGPSGNHYRFTIDDSVGEQRLVKVKDGTVSVLAQRAGGSPDGDFDVVIDAVGDRLSVYLGGARVFHAQDADLATGRVGLHTSNNPSSRFQRFDVSPPPLDGYTLYRDSFDASSTSEWTVVDEGTLATPSKWQASNGIYMQSSEIYSMPTEKDKPDKRGTLAVTGDPAWNEVAVSARLQAIGGAVGMVFRYVDKDNHYRFSMDDQESYARLVKVTGGVFDVLWEAGWAYASKTWADVVLIASGSTLRGFIDGVQMFQVEDADHPTGQAGLYTWRAKGAKFSRVRVYPASLEFAAWLLRNGFDSPGRWSFVDEGLLRPSASWTVTGGVLEQTSAAAGRETSRPGALAVAGDKSWDDYRLVVRLRNDKGEALGIVFRHQSAKEHYRFVLENKTRSFERVDTDGAKELWRDSTPMLLGREYVLTVECVGARFSVHVDGQLACEVVDATFATGAVGVYAYGCPGARFLEFSVAAPYWDEVYRFAGEEPLPAGTRLRVYSCAPGAAPAAPDGVLQRFAAPVGDAGVVRLPAAGADLLVSADDPAVAGHRRRFVSAGAYSGASVAVLRSADGTGLFVMPASGALTAGEYHLGFTYQRDITAQDPNSPVLRQAGSTEPELVGIDVPWEIAT